MTADQKHAPPRCRPLPLLLLFGALAAPGLAAAESAAKQNEGYRSCVKCHDETSDEPVLSILKTKHGLVADGRTPFADRACVSCHGPSLDHVDGDDDNRPAPDVSFREADSAIGNKVCMSCHAGDTRMHWAGSRHDVENVSCASCHNSHVAEDPVLDKALQAEVCIACHQDMRADLYKPFRHPIREGKVACSDCHNSHGSSAVAALVKNNTPETCYTCHADKRGPFLWEHQPVNDDCSICHKPHGSVHVAMLETRGPWLCQQCHLANFHPSTAYSGTGLPGPTRPSGAQQMLGKNCMNCHTEVHGSNHPSGARFTR